MIQVIHLLELVESNDHAKNYVDRIYVNYIWFQTTFILENKDYDTGLEHIERFNYLKIDSFQT